MKGEHESFIYVANQQVRGNVTAAKDVLAKGIRVLKDEA